MYLRNHLDHMKRLVFLVVDNISVTTQDEAKWFVSCEIEGLLNLTIFNLFYVSFNTLIMLRIAMDLSTYTLLSLNTIDRNPKYI